MFHSVKTWGWLAGLLLYAACYEARTTNPDLWFLDVVEDRGSPDPGTEAVTPDPGGETPIDLPGDAPLPETNRATGAPCESDGQCWTQMCLTTDFVKVLNPNLEVPGGMCSLLYCTENSECGPDDGSVCLDASALAEGVTLCAWPCLQDSECRPEYVCPDLGAKDGEGKPLKTCLPAKLVGLIVCDLGKCNADPRDPYCPPVCPE